MDERLPWNAPEVQPLAEVADAAAAHSVATGQLPASFT